MKAIELMCNDLVLFHGNKYKVFGIFGKADCVSLFPIHTRNAEGLVLGPIDCFTKEIEPIPLTPEILEKNDLPQYEWVKIYFQGEYGNITDFSKKLKYVHELQYVLRLCGLNELADNFIIDS